ncbi:MAG: hypothetical protein ACRD2N_02630 [Vicinamibacterales bacterium]
MKTFAAVALVGRPASVGLFLLLNFFQVAEFVHKMPNISNHAVINIVVSLSIFAAALRVWMGNRRTAIPAAELYQSFVPTARVVVLIAYGWTVFHKLNADFFYYPVSAASLQYRMLAARIHRNIGLGFPPTADWALITIVILTIAIEASVVLLLTFRSTRLAGIAVALAFHFVLGVNEFADFAAFLYALMFLFTPENFLAVVRARLHGLEHLLAPIKRRFEAMRIPGSWWALAAICVGVAVTGNSWDHTYMAFRVLWIFYGLAVNLLFLTVLTTWWGRAPRFDELARPSPWFLVFPIITLVNGASPYLGLKTRSCFAMFSNLRTELRWEGDRSNHFLVPSSIKIAGFQEDLVWVVESSDPRLAEIAKNEEFCTFFEFRRHISEAAQKGIRNIRVTYVRHGVQRSLSNAETDPELSRRHPFLLRKLLTFSDVSDGRQRSRH